MYCQDVPASTSTPEPNFFCNKVPDVPPSRAMNIATTPTVGRSWPLDPLSFGAITKTNPASPSAKPSHLRGDSFSWKKIEEKIETNTGCNEQMRAVIPAGIPCLTP
jgi:hypothetical protein